MSTTFSVIVNEEEFKWSLQLEPTDVTSSYTVSLQLLSSQTRIVSGGFEVYTYKDDGKRHSFRKSPVKKLDDDGKWSVANAVKLFGPCIIDDTFTVHCFVTMLINSNNLLYQFKVPESSALGDFGALFENELFSDVTVSAEGTRFKVHKGILAARSPVFAAMFGPQTLEGKNNRVKITDISAEVLRKFLRFIYTDEVTDLDSMAIDLFSVADKYAVNRLKVMCEEALFKNICVESAADTYILASLHSSEELKAHTKDFICRHLAEVKQTPGWKSLTDTHPQLVIDMFCNHFQEQDMSVTDEK